MVDKVLKNGAWLHGVKWILDRSVGYFHRDDHPGIAGTTNTNQPMTERSRFWKMLRWGSLMLTLPGALVAQGQRNCGSMEYLQQQVMADPTRGTRLDQIDSHTALFEHLHGDEERAVVTIPVVFHVIYNSTAQNISDAKLLAQLQQLNDDFARLNSDAGQTPSVFTGLAANTEVQFCLAQRDPSGNATTGIVRRQTTVASFSSNDAVKFTAQGGSDAWPRDSYLNIWVANLSGGLLGYAQFPGGAAATDGVVVLSSSVGSIASPGTGSPFNLGRTATHEVGHWLNLRHIWGDANCGSDLVSDTPTHNTSNGGCPSYPHLSTCSGTPVEMTMNYMDYTDDNCMNIFTLGQKTRMQALFGTGGSRVALLNSLGCTPPSGGGTCTAPLGTAAGSITTSGATISWATASGALSYDVQYKLASASTWTTVNTTATSTAISGLSANTAYNAQVRTNCSGASSAYAAAITFTTQAVGGCPDVLEPNNSTSAPGDVTLPINLNALIASGTDADYYRFTLGTTSNLSIGLSNLAGDYDLRLLNSTGTQLAISENGSTTAENIFYANAAAGTYLIHVFGYNGAFSATQCYALTASAATVATCGVPTGLAASAITTSGSTLSWGAVSGATTYNFQYKLATATTWTTVSGTATSQVLSGLAAGSAYNAQVQAVCASGSSAYSGAITFTTTSTGGGCTDTWESNNTSGTAKLIAVNTNIQGTIGTSTDSDWYRFSNTTSARRIRIDLTNLPADYDVRLYRGTSTQVGIGQNGGTTSEAIILNTTTVATYYIRVYGYNGAFNASSCYTLRASISGTNFREDVSAVEEEITLEPATGLMNLYPNPANDKVMLDYLATQAGQVEVTVFDGMGRAVLRTQLAVSPGATTLGLPLSGLSKGVYVLNLVDGDQQYQQRFVIEP
jgi:hypothetical protein